MDFYDLLDQVVNLIRQRGRVSYRALQRQFDVDDDLLAEIKDEIIYAQHPVVEDGERGLIWAGDTETTPTPDEAQQRPVPQAETYPIVQQTVYPGSRTPPNHGDVLRPGRLHQTF